MPPMLLGRLRRVGLSALGGAARSTTMSSLGFLMKRPARRVAGVDDGVAAGGIERERRQRVGQFVPLDGCHVARFDAR